MNYVDCTHMARVSNGETLLVMKKLLYITFSYGNCMDLNSLNSYCTKLFSRLKYVLSHAWNKVYYNNENNNSEINCVENLSV